MLRVWAGLCDPKFTVGTPKEYLLASRTVLEKANANAASIAFLQRRDVLQRFTDIFNAEKPYSVKGQVSISKDVKFTELVLYVEGNDPLVVSFWPSDSCKSVSIYRWKPPAYSDELPPYVMPSPVQEANTI